MKRYDSEHTCGGSLDNLVVEKVSSKWISCAIHKCMNDNSKIIIRKIMNDISHEEGMEVSYKQAWHGWEHTKLVL